MAEFVQVKGSKKKIDISDPAWKDLVVKIGAAYYFRKDDAITRVNINKGVDGKTSQYRYFRKKSNLIVQDYDGKYILKKNGTQLDSGDWVDNVVAKKYVVKTVDGKLCWDTQCAKIGTKYYDFGSPAITTDAITGKYILKESGQRLGYHENNVSSNLYRHGVNPFPMYTTNNAKIKQCSYDNQYYYRGDIKTIPDVKSGESRLVFKDNLQFIPNLSYRYYSLAQKDYDYVINDDKTVLLPGFNLPVHQDSVDALLKQLKNDYNPTKYRKDGHINFIKDNFKLFKEVEQNNPEYFNGQRGHHQGGDVIMSCQPALPSRKSALTGKTGRIGYTYGIEFETAAGTPPLAMLENLNLNIMSDGSLRHEMGNAEKHGINHFQGYEYVTKPMHGNLGIENVQQIVELLKNFTLLSNVCSTHVHVGGKRYGDKESATPIFNREFAARALKLGAIVEDDLFDLLPKERKGARHCQSIKKWGNKIINPVKTRDPIEVKQDKKAMLEYNPDGGLVKQKKEKETRMTRHDNYESQLVDFVWRNGNKKFDSRTNQTSRLGRWANGRYVWLNLINCSTDNSGRAGRGGGFKTIEFRAFPATHDFNDVYFYILFSLSFVWFVENRPQEIIDGNVTLRKMMSEAIKNEKVRKFALQYIRNKKR